VEAIILAGGFGTRLQGALPDRPKPLAEIGGRPFLSRLLDQLAKAGIRRTILCTGYKADQIEKTLGDCFGGQMALIASREEEPLGTGGALRLAESRMEQKLALIMNGDSYVATDLRPFISWHLQAHHKGSLLLVKTDDVARFGSVSIDDDGKITAFEEKSDAHQGGWINGGIYLLSRDLLHEIPSDRPVSLENKIFPKWAAAGLLYGYRAEENFIDIGTPESLASASAFFRSLRQEPNE